MPLDTSIQAEYLDGFILDETELEDKNPWGLGNTLTAVLDEQLEWEHGPMVRFSVFWKNSRYDIDWEKLPSNARPIRFRKGFATIGSSGIVESGFYGVDFGYQYTDEDGKNVQEVRELR